MTRPKQTLVSILLAAGVALIITISVSIGKDWRALNELKKEPKPSPMVPAPLPMPATVTMNSTGTAATTTSGVILTIPPVIEEPPVLWVDYPKNCKKVKYTFYNTRDLMMWDRELTVYADTGWQGSMMRPRDKRIKRSIDVQCMDKVLRQP